MILSRLIVFVCCLTSVPIAMAQFGSIAPTLVPESLIIINTHQNTARPEQPTPPSVALSESESLLQVGSQVRDRLYRQIGEVVAVSPQAAIVRFNDDRSEEYSYEKCFTNYRNNHLKLNCVSDRVLVHHDLRPTDPNIPYDFFYADILGINLDANKVIVRVHSALFSRDGFYIYNTDDIEALDFRSNHRNRYSSPF